MNQKKPVIGIILDWEAKGSFSDFPYFALRTHYIDAIRLAGGTPFLIPYGDTDSVADYLQLIDGLLVPGGFYAMPNSWYEGKDEQSPYQKTPRFEFEEVIIKQALNLDMPMLCICAGMQVLAGLFGCKLTADVSSLSNQSIEHFDLTKNHDINIAIDTILHKIVGKSVISTNSHHREAITSVKAPIIVSARANDKVIEAIELKGKKFVLATQWHPEMLCHAGDQINDQNPHHLIFKEFINAAKN
ncbi:MAG: gamma-glutamyl-gamma-aminobutyrate hydrolase family protein [Rickettsiales bacterium]|nr:gamma-glutamyl-gamma-aminobutyrate hydrolase family protein [Rickettsiales bacterium]